MDVDYTRLPPKVRLEDTISEIDQRPVPDPEAGLNTDQRMAVQYAGG